MWRLLVLLSILHPTTAYCPDWFDIVKDGVCAGPVRKMNCNSDNPQCMASNCAYPNNPEISPPDPSKTQHAVLGLKPVIIHDYEAQSYWTGIAAKNKKSIFLGLLCNNYTKRFEWYDGSILDFLPDTYEKIDFDDKCSGADRYPWYIDPTGKWNREDSHFDVYCVGQLPRLPTRDSCDSFSEDIDRCYQVGSPAKNWNDAQEACQLTGSELASIHNEQENSFIHKLAISKGAANGLFIGGSFSQEENGTDFTWSDGSEWDFDNSYAGYSGAGDCIAMDTFSPFGRWLNTDCSKKLPYVCARPDTTRQCPSGPWKVGDVITSPGCPYDASVSCEYILSVDPGKFVQVQIEELQANSCCDNLFLADDKIGGEVVAKVTGQIVAGQPKTFNSASNFMRVSWQPSGGVNVKGFKMTYRAVDNANEGPLTTTHTIPTSTTKPTTTTTRKIITTTAESLTSTTVKPTTSGTAKYGLSFVVLTLLLC